MKYKFILSLACVIMPAMILGGCQIGKAKDKTPQATTAATPKPRVNVIDIKERPYVTLQPLSDRNTLEFRVSSLPKKADSVEVVLGYNRNKGVDDAVLKDFTLDKIPYIDKLFMGSKSAGGHITYHEDVVGGTLTLTFKGKENYALEVPWRYDDTQQRYSELSTADQRFQVNLDQPFRTPKVVVMQSPGLPAEVKGTVIAGPYLVRGVGPLPDIKATVTIHLPEAAPEAKLLGFNGQKWQELTSKVDGNTLTATVPFVETYVVVK